MSVLLLPALQGQVATGLEGVGVSCPQPLSREGKQQKSGLNPDGMLGPVPACQAPRRKGSVTSGRGFRPAPCRRYASSRGTLQLVYGGGSIQPSLRDREGHQLNGGGCQRPLWPSRGTAQVGAWGPALALALVF